MRSLRCWPSAPGVALLFCGVLGAGCADERERLTALCTQLEARAVSAHDCPALAAELEALIDEERELVERVRDMPAPSDAAEQRAWRLALEPCLRARLDLATGVCAADPAVREAMSVFVR